ncbi:MAG: hypothetical protein K0S74_1242 [Chlamydiales bacterium]|jgi:hypothetical protein|nr:hypothetical protein [Chlamydiales bacterium]
MRKSLVTKLIFISNITSGIFLQSTVFSVHPTSVSTSKTTVMKDLSDQQAILALDHLIAITQSNLELQQNLRRDIETYLQVKAKFFAKSQDQELSESIVTAAATVWRTIQTKQLASIFPSEFIEEISLFAQLNNNQGLSRP